MNFQAAEDCAPRSSSDAVGRDQREGRKNQEVALYARVTTLDQNCDLQLADLRRYVSQRFSRAYEYVDQGVSGAQRRRPAFDNLMKDAQKRMFDVVLVWKFDHFARSLKHLMESLEEFGGLGIDFVSFTEGIDTTTPSGQMLFHIVGAVAQFERDLIAERVRAGLAHARAMGKHRQATGQSRPPAGENFAKPWDVVTKYRAHAGRSGVTCATCSKLTASWKTKSDLPVVAQFENNPPFAQAARDVKARPEHAVLPCDRLGPATPDRRARRRSMSRRSGQIGYIERKGNAYYVRSWIDVPGQEKRAHKSVRICPVRGPGKLTKPEREREARDVIEERS